MISKLKRYFTEEQHIERLFASDDIRNQGQLVASAMATEQMLAKVPIESCLVSRNEILIKFKKGIKADLLTTILTTQHVCKENAEFFNPGAMTNNISFQTRRQELISRIVRNEIAEDTLAVQTADLVLGRITFKIENNILFKEWKERQTFECQPVK